MKGIVEKRAVTLGNYIAESGDTVRQTAKKFGISKSTVHKDVSSRLQKINPSLYLDVKKVLEINKVNDISEVELPQEISILTLENKKKIHKQSKISHYRNRSLT